MGISLLTELDLLSNDSMAGEFNTAFFITYSLSLRFFEQLVMPRLNRLGVVNIGVLTDEHGYQSSLSDPLGQEQCGKSYVVGTPQDIDSLQHAKMLWLHGEHDIAYLGSHNLTMSGYNDQLEITAKLDSLNATHGGALRDLHQAVSIMTSGKTHLQQIWSRIPFPAEGRGEPSMRFLWSGENGLLSQLSAIVSPVEQLTVVTPFLDASALAQLKAAVGATRIRLIVPNEGTDTPLINAVNAVKGLTTFRLGAGRRLHGKAYWFKSDARQWLALGSANCTIAGLVKGVKEGGNVEFLLLMSNCSLPEDELSLEPVDDANELPGTGRRWDEERANSVLVRIDSAEYSNGVLTVYWEPLGHLSSVSLVCGELRFPCTESPLRVQTDVPPSIISIEGEASGKISTTSTWVIFPEELSAQVSKAHAKRWHEYLASENPGELAAGIDAYLLQLLRDLMSTDVAEPKAFRDTTGPNADDIKDAVEIFTFSSDSKRITAAASVLVYGNPLLDPLGALRGLVARMQGSPPNSVEGDEDELARYEERRQKAGRRITDRLISHLNTLSGPNQDWASTPSSRVVSCLRGTFEAVALLWHDVVADDPRYSTYERFAESFLRFLATCIAFDETKSACRNISVAGPLVLAIGAAADAANETESYELLRKTSEKLVKNPQIIVGEWLRQNTKRAALLLTHGHRGSDLTTWLRPALRLLGQLDASTRNRQEHHWGLLLRLYQADRIGDKSASELFKEGEQQYGNHEVWQSYKAARAVGRLPKMTRVTSPVCMACHLQFPASTRSKLERGDAALCPNCKAIILWGDK